MIGWVAGSDWLTGAHRIPYMWEIWFSFSLLKKKLIRSPRGEDMESKEKKVELLQIAIKRLIKEEKEKGVKRSSCSDDDGDDGESFIAVCSDGDDADDHRLLSKLLSQLQTFKDGDGMAEELEPSVDIQNVDFAEDGEKNGPTDEARSSSSGLVKEEIVRELKELKRQNFITHCLLSAMIVLTVAWQLSEVSLILKIKEGLSNPLKSLGSIIGGVIKRPTVLGQEKQRQVSDNQNPLLRTSHLPGLKIPVLPRVELPVFDLDDEEE